MLDLAATCQGERGVCSHPRAALTDLADTQPNGAGFTATLAHRRSACHGPAAGRRRIIVLTGQGPDSPKTETDEKTGARRSDEELKNRKFPWVWRPDPLRTKPSRLFHPASRKRGIPWVFPSVVGLISSVIGIAPSWGVLLRTLGLPI